MLCTTKEVFMFLRKCSYILPGICLAFALISCSSGSEDISSDYKENVEVEISLGPASGLNDIKKDDIFFTVRNNGDKTITDLMAEITFLYPDGNETMQREWYLIDKDKWMEKGSLEEDSVVFRPLPPGSVIDFGWAMVIFFIGKPEMREKASKRAKSGIT
jgi:hypothetical protein